MKARKSILALAMALTIGASALPAFAASFSDMKDAKGNDHWSIAYVNDISDKKLVSGYADGTFKPNNPVSRIEAIVFISRLYDPEDVKSVYEANKAKWADKLRSNAIPEFAKSAVVYGLEKNLYSEAYLKEFMNAAAKTQKSAQRYEFAVYLVRALGWQKDLSNAAVVKYTDVNSIPKQAVPYVELLGKKGVIATEGAFNPLKTVTRAEVAKMLSITYPHSERAKGTGSTATTTDPLQEGKVVMPSGTQVTGTIKSISEDASGIIVTITRDNGSISSFTNRTTGVVISLDGKEAKSSSIKEGYLVTLYTDGITLKGIEATTASTNVNKKLSGDITEVSRNSIQIKDRSTTERYDFASSVVVTKNGKTASVSDLVAGDSVDVKIENSLVTAVDAYTVKRTLKNVTVKEFTSYANNTARIVVDDEDGNRYVLEFTANSQAFMSNKRVGVASIAVGYEADVYTNSNEIIDIMLYGMGKGTVVEGTITEVNQRDNYFYIKKSDGTELRVNLARDTQIVEWPNSTKKYIDDLAKGYRVILNGYEGSNVFEATNVAYYK